MLLTKLAMPGISTRFLLRLGVFCSNLFSMLFTQRNAEPDEINLKKNGQTWVEPRGGHFDRRGSIGLSQKLFRFSSLNRVHFIFAQPNLKTSFLNIVIIVAIFDEKSLDQLDA